MNQECQESLEKFDLYFDYSEFNRQWMCPTNTEMVEIDSFHQDPEMQDLFESRPSGSSTYFPHNVIDEQIAEFDGFVCKDDYKIEDRIDFKIDNKPVSTTNKKPAKTREHDSTDHHSAVHNSAISETSNSQQKTKKKRKPQTYEQKKKCTKNLLPTIKGIIVRQLYQRIKDKCKTKQQLDFLYKLKRPQKTPQAKKQNKNATREFFLDIVQRKELEQINEQIFNPRFLSQKIMLLKSDLPTKICYMKYVNLIVEVNKKKVFNMIRFRNVSN